MFRAQLILHDKVREVFESSLRLARESGYLKKRGRRVALDTTNILGRGAVRDTCNLLADGIVKLLRALAAVERSNVKGWAEAQGYERYLGSSIKGESAIDWSDRKARTALLGEIVADADRLLEMARQAQGGSAGGQPGTAGHRGGGGVAGAVAAPGRGAHRRRYWPQRRSEQGPDGVGARPGDAPRPQEQPTPVRRAQGGDRGGHRLPVDHGRGRIARQRSRQPGGLGTGAAE